MIYCENAGFGQTYQAQIMDNNVYVKHPYYR